MKRRLKITTCLGIGILCLASSLAPAAGPFFCIHLSDPQFGMSTDNRYFAQEKANFEFAVATVNRLRPAFVVITGDLPAGVQVGQRLALLYDGNASAKMPEGVKRHMNRDVGLAWLDRPLVAPPG